MERLITFCLLVSVFCGCSSTDDSNMEQVREEQYSITINVFPFDSGITSRQNVNESSQVREVRIQATPLGVYYFKNWAGDVNSTQNPLTVVVNQDMYLSANFDYHDFVFNPDLEYGTVTDIDNNQYKTIQIGSQTWMAENLRTTRFNNGEEIVEGNQQYWRLFQDSKYANYNEIESFSILYGRLYNGWTLRDHATNVCPKGWHVPSLYEWQVLMEFIGEDPSNKLKETGELRWLSNKGATNSSGLTILPGGLREADGSDRDIRRLAGFWTARSNGTLNNWAYFVDDDVYQQSQDLHVGLCIRCVKD